MRPSLALSLSPTSLADPRLPFARPQSRSRTRPSSTAARAATTSAASTTTTACSRSATGATASTAASAVRSPLSLSLSRSPFALSSSSRLTRRPSVFAGYGGGFGNDDYGHDGFGRDDGKFGGRGGASTFPRSFLLVRARADSCPLCRLRRLRSRRRLRLVRRSRRRLWRQGCVPLSLSLSLSLSRSRPFASSTDPLLSLSTRAGYDNDYGYGKGGYGKGGFGKGGASSLRLRPRPLLSGARTDFSSLSRPQATAAATTTDSRATATAVATAVATAAGTAAASTRGKRRPERVPSLAPRLSPPRTFVAPPPLPSFQSWRPRAPFFSSPFSPSPSLFPATMASSRPRTAPRAARPSGSTSSRRARQRRCC